MVNPMHDTAPRPLASAGLTIANRQRKSNRHHEGFTLIELLVVLAIVAMLLSLAVPRYVQSVDKAKETVLADTLRQTRAVLDTFHGDIGRYPQTLDELVEKRYLKALPFDPVTGSASDWVIEAPKEGMRGGVYNLRSGAEGSGRDGRPYAEW
jgi:general secretion pathway protein G